MDGFQSHRLLVELLTEPVELNRASRPPVSALRYDLTQVTQRQTVNRDRAIRLVGDSLNIRDNSLARDRRTLWRSAVHGSNGAATQIEQWREAVRTRNAAAAKYLPPSSICGWRVAASAIDAMQQIPAREMPVQARDPSLELGVLIKRPFGVRVTNGCEIV